MDMSQFIDQNMDLFTNIINFVVAVYLVNHIVKNMQKGTEETKKMTIRASVDTIVCVALFGVVFYCVLSVISLLDAFGLMKTTSRFLGLTYNLGIIPIAFIYFVAEKSRKSPKVQQKKSANLFFPITYED